MSGQLARILESKRVEIEALRRRTPGQRRASRSMDVRAALRDKRAVRVIAEVKRKSPSAGTLAADANAGERACAYADGGAAMVSILCDLPFFGGSYEDLENARNALDAAGHTGVPLLAKEFILDEVQVERAWEAGADAALVIVRIVSRPVLRTLVDACRARGLEPVVEVTSEDELRAALDAGAAVIGVNARDLDALAMDLEGAARVLASIPADRVAVHFSGIRGPSDVARLTGTRADAVLVGEALMRAADPRELLKRMLAAAAR